MPYLSRERAATSTMVFEDRIYRGRIYQMEMRNGVAGHPRYLNSFEDAEYPVHGPHSSGSVAFFVSNDQNVHDLVVQKTNEIGFRRLSPGLPGDARSPAWSPDAGHIAFVASWEGSAAVWIADTGTGAVRRLTGERDAEGCPSWSRDGRWIYFRSSRQGTARFWRMAWAAGGKIEPVSPAATYGFESPGSDDFVFLESGHPGRIMRVPLNSPGSAATPVTALPMLGVNKWRVIDEGILCIDETAGTDCGLELYSWPGGMRQQLTRFPAVPANLHSWSYSPDGGLLWCQSEIDQNIWILENFR
jgi:WD40 repeat protein